MPAGASHSLSYPCLLSSNENPWQHMLALPLRKILWQTNRDLPFGSVSAIALTSRGRAYFFFSRLIMLRQLFF